MGPWRPSPFAGADVVAPGLLSPELEHAATAGIKSVKAAKV